jgi:plasmid stability protein
MTDIVIRNAPSDTIKKAKVRAVELGVTFKQWVVDAMEWRLDDEGAAGIGGADTGEGGGR